jgi:hypothetical protein
MILLSVSITLCTAIAAYAQNGQDALFLPVVAANARVDVDSNVSPTDSPEERAIALVAAVPEVAAHLASYPEWSGDAYFEDANSQIYEVSFYSESANEWLGSGQANIETGEVLDYYVPRELAPEEYQQQLAQVKMFLDDDPEVQGRLVPRPDFWEEYIDYNRWDQNWQAYYSRGLEEFVVVLAFYDGDLYIDQIYDPWVFDAEQEVRRQRDLALELVWQANGIDGALDGVDNWATYAAQQSDSIWTVEFVTEDQLLFSALVDIENWQILE